MHDIVVIGSGVGGAVAACRLASAGLDVVVLERGRRWAPDDYPRDADDAWIFDVDEPEKQNGWIDLRILDDIWVAQGAGVGGGSLIYANVSINAPPAVFEAGWPSEITHDALLPYYERVENMLKPEVLPDNQLTPRFELMREAARKTGAADRFRKVELAVSFDPQGSFPDQQPESDEAVKKFTNEFGREQGFCVHCGNCDIGCKAQAKNTLDLNYLAVAEDNGAEIRPLSLVSHIAPVAGGYRVFYDALDAGRRRPKTVEAARVVLAAGSLGSTEILLKSKGHYRTLPAISDSLGHNWSSNGDFLTPARYGTRELFPTRGPTISCAIDYLDGSDGGARYFVEDGGLPDLLHNLVRAKRKGRRRVTLGTNLLSLLHRGLRDLSGIDHTMPWFGQAIDAGDGRCYYGRDWLRPWKKRLKLDWNPARSAPVINALVERHKKLSAATGGQPRVPAMWTVFRNLVTPHPLGGCGMADGPSDGVVDHLGHVFGYPGLFVADGAIIPRAVGLNPSKTIAALSERIVESMLRNPAQDAANSATTMYC